MSSVWEEFRNGGWMNWIILLFGMAGIMVALVAFVLAVTKSRAALSFGAAAVLFGAFIAGLGLIGMSTGRRVVDDAVGGGAISTNQVERIRRVGYAETLSCVRFGIGFSALPILAGVVAVIVGATRRKQDAEPPPTPWTTAPSSSGAPPAPVPSLSPSPSPSTQQGGGLALPVAALGVAGVLLAGSFAALATPLPGRDIDENDRTAEEALTDDLSGVGETEPPSKDRDGIGDERPDLNPPGEASAEPVAVEPSATPTAADPSAKAVAGAASAASTTSAAASSAPSKARAGAAQVSGRLPAEVIARIVRRNMPRFRLCYENGLRNNPNLQGRVSVRFVIGLDGAVANVGNGGSDMPDSGVVSCVVRGFYGMTFPKPEAGIVTVVYPIVFSPG